MDTIESRIAAVERQLRFHRAVIAGLLIALVALVGYGATEGVPDVVRAKRFEAVNDVGSVGAELDMFGLTVKDVFNAEPYIWLTYRSLHGPTLRLFSGQLGLPKPEGRMRIEIKAGEEQEPGAWIQIYNNTGEVVVQAGVDDYGMGYVGAFNRQGKGPTLTPR